MPAPAARRAALWSWWAPLATILALALALRLWGINWGAPFVYHPDEHFVLHPALDMVRERDPNPHWFQYPSLLLYVEALLTLTLQPIVYAPLTTNAVQNAIGPWDALPEQWPFVLAGRWVVALSGIVGIGLLAGTGRRWHSATTGLSAGLLFAVVPLAVDSAHYLTTDIPAAALIAATLWATLRIDDSHRPLLSWFVAGMCAGFAAGTKYTAGFVLLAPIVAALDVRDPVATLQRLTYLAGGAALAFFLACPYALLDMTNFLRGLDEQRHNYSVASTPDHAWTWYLTYVWSAELQPAAAAAAVVGLLFALRSHRRADFVMLIPPAVYYTAVAQFPSRPERNIIPLLPFFCLFAGRAIAAAREWSSRLLPTRLAMVLATTLAVLVAWPPAREAVRRNRERVRPDTRTIAWQWITANVPEGACVAREEYTPQLSAARYRVVYLWSLAQRPYSWYLAQPCDYIVASSHVYGRVTNPPFIGGPTAAEFYRILFTLPVVREFAPGAAATGPTIRIFKVPR
jgi:4-amino-4-deoxy-L-arabinose transferase-like glycosyltransferase